MSDDSNGSNGRNGVLGRAMDVIELVANETNGVGVREAARLTGIDRSAVSRILAHLEKTGHVEQDPVRKVYLPGPALFSLAAGLVEHDSLWKAAEPFLAGLVDKYNETCYLAVRSGEELSFRGKVDCNHRIRYVIELGPSFPLTTGAGGTAILAGMPEPESDAVLSKGFERYTELSFQNFDDYRNQLRADRHQGYTFSPGRWVKNGAGVASPYFNAAGESAGSIIFSAPSDRLEGVDIQQLGADVRSATQGLSRRLGFRGQWEGWPEEERSA